MRFNYNPLSALARNSALGAVLVLSFTGIGHAGSPAVTFSPTSLTFASQRVGTTSPGQNITLTNSGTATLNITKISLTGLNKQDYAQTNTCGSTLAAGASCTITVTFTPTVKGTRTANVSVTDNATGSPQSAGLSGTGIAPFVRFTPTSLTFAGQNVGTTSAAQTVTLKNTGTATLNISSISASGDFAQTNNCAASLVVNASCTLTVTFTPTVSGTRTGNISVTDDASGSPQTVPLTGTGLGPVVTLSPSSLTFGNQTVGTTSAAQNATLSNTGNATLTITSITIGGDYAQTNTCGSSVAAGANCTISVAFTPTATGTRTGTVTVNDNAPGSPHTVSLTGTGTSAAAPIVTLSVSSLSFGNQAVNTTSPAQNFTLSNTGNATLNLTSVAASGDFAQTNTCGSTVPANTNCSISVTFTPTVAGARTGAVTFTDNAADSPQTVTLSGTGTSPSGQTLTTLGPTARVQASAAFDSATNTMLTFGGQNPGLNNFNDVWQLIIFEDVNIDWLPISPTGAAPSARYGQSGVYDSTNSRFIVYGGAGGVGAPSPCLSDVSVLKNANSSAGTPAWLTLAPTGNAPVARYAHAAVYDATNNKMIVFGGSDCASGFFNDVYVLSNANGLGGTPSWTKLAPTGSGPLGRENATAVYDAANNILIVYAGDSGGPTALKNDVWILTHANGTGGTPVWAQLFPTGTAPKARTGHSAIYDSVGNRMVIYGGVDGSSTVLGDTFILAGANGQAGTPSWTAVTAPNGTPKAYHTVIYNAATDEMLVWAGEISVLGSDDHIFVLSGF